MFIDEAQNLDDSVLELIRMLSNFETPREKLIQIVLSGQPELAEKIASPDLEQLRQRVSIFSELTPFSREDTQLYIEHRLRIAGYAFAGPLFTRDALALIAEASEGIPRNINNLCFNALSLAYALQRKPIDSEIIRAVIADRDLGRFRKRTSLASHVRGEWAGKRRLHFVQRSAHLPDPGDGRRNSRLLLRLLSLWVGCLFAGRWWPGNKAAMHAQSEAAARRSNSFRFVAAPPAVSNAPCAADCPGRNRPMRAR